MTNLLASEGGYQAFTLRSIEKGWLFFAMATGVVALLVAVSLMRGVLAADQGTTLMQEIAAAIQEGAVAFLRRQFRVIAIIVVPLAALVFLTATKVVDTTESATGRAFVRPRSGLYPGDLLPRWRDLQRPRRASSA